MTVPDEERRDLYAGLAGLLDEKRANTLMELLPPAGWSDVARRSDIAEFRGEMAGLRSELRGEMAELRADVRSELADFRIAMVRTLIALVIGLAGLYLAIVSFAVVSVT